MATGKIRADINFVNMYPRAKIHTRTRARNPPRARNDTRNYYLRISTYPRARPYTASFRKSSTHYISTADKHHLFKETNKFEQTNELVSYMNT
jgi:hypothetical protein